MNELTLVDNLCKVTQTSLSFKRDVTKKEWQKVFDACNHIEGCIQFWIGDLLKYRDQQWGMYDDVAEQTGIDKETLRDYKKVSENIESGVRTPNLTFSHHKKVAYLEPEKQKEFLQKAVDDSLSVRELAQEIKADKRKNLKPIPLPPNTYKIIYADPPWSYNDKQETKMLGGAEKHYPTMSIDDLCNMVIPKTQDNAVLFLWTTSPLLEESFTVIKSWGFEYKTSFIWDKVKHNMGHYNSVRHELLLVCTKGSCTPENIKLYDSVQSIEKTKKHSQKPIEFMNIIDTLYPSGKRIELFAREKQKDNWEIWGNEL